MNALDAGIIGVLVAFFVIRAHLSGAYYAIGATVAFAGYIAGLALAPLAGGHTHSSVTRGVLALLLMFGIAALGGLLGRFVGRRVKMKLVMSRAFRTDKLLLWPCKVVIALVAVLLLAQTLAYVPILGLQFEAQGSTLLRVSDKLVQSPPLNHMAARIDPNQFRNLHLAYDPNPLTYNNIHNAGAFQQAVDEAAPSIVKVSGRNCVGLGFGSGFVVAPGLVVTNAHVISGASSIYVADHHGVYPATPMVIDNNYDIAVLYSRFLADPPLRFAKAAPVVGSQAVSLGYPSAEDLQLRTGSVIARTYKSSHNALNGANTITITGGLGHGSSGGPVLNVAGEVVGVNDAGGDGNLIAIQGHIAKRLTEKAQHKIGPSSTDFCGVAPNFY